MYEIITIRADYEGWWLFEGYRDQATDIQTFELLYDAQRYYQQQINTLRARFCNEITGQYYIHAFYNNCEIEFCEACDEDVQIFHSVIFLNDGVVYPYELI
ncbi:DUF1033 family protein [Macrococcus capreoli]|uniref:DUF1033 family protein n=1 Tax=Macrococcus capreoli TaxID=2982690 RepID=UPI0021D60DF0|nr:DUF1033 family protein [Macrococcus sp. TMW 2.2395]MCU7556690.1 DUF1033 family protein [Macrococcus sp. TMW 2.2395]